MMTLHQIENITKYTKLYKNNQIEILKLKVQYSKWKKKSLEGFNSRFVLEEERMSKRED